MDLYSPQNIPLLKKCIIINSTLGEKQEDLDYFQGIYEKIKKANNLDAIHDLISKEQNGSHSSFYEHISITPAKEIYEEYITFIESTLTNIGFTKEDIEKSKNAFSDGIENLVTPNPLEKLSKLLKDIQYKDISASQFKKFAKDFRDLTKNFGIKKLQESFEEKNISDMKISHENTTNQTPIYRIDLNLVDTNLQETHQKLTGRAHYSEFISTYFQNLCYSYLEANKYSSIDENLLDSSIIAEKVQTFSDCYQKLKEMSQYKLNILPNGTISPSAISADEPSKEIEQSSKESDLLHDF